MPETIHVQFDPASLPAWTQTCLICGRAMPTIDESVMVCISCVIEDDDNERGDTEMPDTISTRFDPTDLPAWTRRYPEIVRRCRTDYTFRVNVCRAETSQMQRRLLDETRRLDAERAHR